MIHVTAPVAGTVTLLLLQLIVFDNLAHLNLFDDHRRIAVYDICQILLQRLYRAVAPVIIVLWCVL